MLINTNRCVCDFEIICHVKKNVIIIKYRVQSNVVNIYNDASHECCAGKDNIFYRKRGL